MAWDTATLLSRVRRKLRIPDGDSAMSNAELLAIGDEVTRIHILATLRKTTGEWYVTQYTTPLVAGQEAYRIPERVQAAGVRDVTLVDSNNNEIDLPEVLLEHARVVYRSGSIAGHFIEDNNVIIRPAPTSADYTLSIRYRRQPSSLIETTDTRISLLTGGSGPTVSSEDVPSALQSSVEADVVMQKAPFDLITTGVGSGDATSFTFDDSTIDTDSVIEGDYLCVAGLTPIPQVPPVCHDLLVYGIALVAAQELGMDQKAGQLSNSFGTALDNVYEQLRDRNEGALQKIIPRYSPLRQRRSWGFW